MSSRASTFSLLALACALSWPLVGCGGADPSTGTPGEDAGTTHPAVASVAHPAHYVTEVVSFTPGEGGGFGADQLPSIVQSAPHGGGCCYGSLDVVSLGNGGEIVLGFDPPIVDGEGDDFIVFENPFRIANDPNNVFTEYGEVAVSEDGVTWTTFPCDPTGARATCAGWREVYATLDEPVETNASAKAGGDPFDLATIGVKKAKLIRIRDLRSNRPAQQGMAGFDLDAVAALHW
jgi:hypothetical protein